MVSDKVAFTKKKKGEREEIKNKDQRKQASLTQVFHAKYTEPLLDQSYAYGMKDPKFSKMLRTRGKVLFSPSLGNMRMKLNNG